jgi:predicted nucleic acid-binding protein
LAEDPSSGETVVEASPLISFLKIDRFDIIESVCPTLLCTDHVSGEVLLFRQRERLEALLAAGRIREVTISDPTHLAEYARLTEESPLGPGEASSLLYAAYHGCRLVITDKKGIREAKRRGVACITTEEVMVHAIQSGILTLIEADHLIVMWKALDEFPVTITSFASLVHK